MISNETTYAVTGSVRAAASARLLLAPLPWIFGVGVCPQPLTGRQHVADERLVDRPKARPSVVSPLTASRRDAFDPSMVGVSTTSPVTHVQFVKYALGSSVWRPPV